jgi:hypothetical protein
VSYTTIETDDGFSVITDVDRGKLVIDDTAAKVMKTTGQRNPPNVAIPEVMKTTGQRNPPNVATTRHRAWCAARCARKHEGHRATNDPRRCRIDSATFESSVAQEPSSS